jgi:hypothetical protein
MAMSIFGVGREGDQGEAASQGLFAAALAGGDTGDFQAGLGAADQVVDEQGGRGTGAKPDHHAILDQAGGLVSDFTFELCGVHDALPRCWNVVLGQTMPTSL